MSGIFRAIICFGFAILLISLLMSGEISLFVNPRFKWLIATSIFLLTVLGLVQLWNIKGKEMHRIGVVGYGIVLLPLLMYIFLPPKPLDASMAAKKGVTYLTPQAIANQQKAAKAQPVLTNANSAKTDSTQPADPATASAQPAETDWDNPYKKQVSQLKKQAVIKLTEQNYMDVLNTVNLYPKEFVGKKIRVMGFVYRDETMKQNQFVVGRFSVTCCTADASVVGFLTKAKNAEQFKLNQWIEVQGELKTTMVDGFEMPVIQLETYQNIKAPKDPYVYFN